VGAHAAAPRNVACFAQPVGAVADDTEAEDGNHSPMTTVTDSRTSHQQHVLNPALVEHARERRQSLENRIADTITAFSGSMRFVYLHAAWFTLWIALGVEAYPYGLLTMIVSLEAIFLSTFLLISQNRADAKREVLANQQWATIQDEDGQNQELLRLSEEMLELVKAIHARSSDQASVEIQHDEKARDDRDVAEERGDGDRVA
jgi:uncharacterized membrane protein